MKNKCFIVSELGSELASVRTKYVLRKRKTQWKHSPAPQAETWILTHKLKFTCKKWWILPTPYDSHPTPTSLIMERSFRLKYCLPILTLLPHHNRGKRVAKEPKRNVRTQPRQAGTFRDSSFSCLVLIHATAVTQPCYQWTTGPIQGQVTLWSRNNMSQRYSVMKDVCKA